MSKDVMTPLSTEERAVLDNLLRRAQMQETLACDAASVLSTDTDWQVASMSDACKRRCDVSPERDPRVHGYADFSQTGAPLPSEVKEAFGKTKRGSPVLLPEGLSDLAMWGRSIVEFGKYESRGYTYSEMAESSEKEMMNYVKWCKSQVDNAEGLLKDFAMYLVARDFRQTSLKAVMSSRPLGSKVQNAGLHRITLWLAWADVLLPWESVVAKRAGVALATARG
eukprot:s941_g15.t1